MRVVFTNNLWMDIPIFNSIKTRWSSRSFGSFILITQCSDKETWRGYKYVVVPRLYINFLVTHGVFCIFWIHMAYVLVHGIFWIFWIFIAYSPYSGYIRYIVYIMASLGYSGTVNFPSRWFLYLTIIGSLCWSVSASFQQRDGYSNALILVWHILFILDILT